MIVNPNKFQAIKVTQDSDTSNKYTFNFDDNQVTSDKSLKQLKILMIIFFSMNTFPHYVKKQTLNITQ